MSHEHTPLLPYNAATLHGALVSLTQYSDREGRRIPELVDSIESSAGYVVNPYLVFSENKPVTYVARQDDNTFLIKDQYPPVKGHDDSPAVFKYGCRFHGKDEIQVSEEGRAWRDLRHGSPEMVGLLGRLIREDARLNPPPKEGRIKRFVGKFVESMGRSLINSNPYI